MTPPQQAVGHRRVNFIGTATQTATGPLFPLAGLKTHCLMADVAAASFRIPMSCSSVYRLPVAALVPPCQ
jgi:hypothetical protein